MAKMLEGGGESLCFQRYIMTLNYVPGANRAK